MKIKEVKFYKEYKIGLPNYSNISAGYGMTIEVGENEKISNEKCWDIVNQQLSIQSEGIDPSWIKTGEFKNYFKTEIRTPIQKIKNENRNGVI